jgi:Amt family ammonium transporter
VGAFTAVFIGVVAGVLVIVSAVFIETRLRIDDPVGASSVHCVCGAWGILALGLFANGAYGDGLNGVPGTVKGLFFGDAGQLGAECIGIIVNVAWVGGTAAISMKLIDALFGNRAAREDELVGLDVPELGMPGYSDELGDNPGARPQAAPRPSVLTTTVAR